MAGTAAETTAAPAPQPDEADDTTMAAAADDDALGGGAAASADQGALQRGLYEAMLPWQQAITDAVVRAMADAGAEAVPSQVALALQYYDTAEHVMDWLWSGAEQVETSKTIHVPQR